jgi:glycerate 2-kinase
VTIVVAPDSFKGTYTAAEVAEHVSAGIEAVGAQANPVPVADGGEGTLDCLRQPMKLSLVMANCRNPWGSPMRGRYGVSPEGTAVIEIAEASGITTTHVGPRDPVTANTYGTGMLVVDAVRRGARHVVIAAGGSATSDGGRGAIAAIRDGGLTPETVTVLTDVTTLFTDAAKVFGPQKGADPATVELLTRRLDDQANHYPRDPRHVPGGGAAGGFAGGMWAVFGAQIVPGADFVLDKCGFDEALRQASAVVVGEGRLDSQTKAGKIISAILRRTQNVPVYAVVGSVTDYAGDDFAGVVVASDATAMRDAGSEIASLTQLFVRR